MEFLLQISIPQRLELNVMYIIEAEHHFHHSITLERSSCPEHVDVFEKR